MGVFPSLWREPAPGSQSSNADVVPSKQGTRPSTVLGTAGYFLGLPPEAQMCMKRLKVKAGRHTSLRRRYSHYTNLRRRYSHLLCNHDQLWGLCGADLGNHFIHFYLHSLCQEGCACLQDFRHGRRCPDTRRGLYQWPEVAGSSVTQHELNLEWSSCLPRAPLRKAES